MRTETRHGQCLADVAIERLGALEGVWTLALRNGLSVTSELTTGQGLEWMPEDVEDARMAALYASEGIHPATEITAPALAALLSLPDEKPGTDIGDEPGEEPNTMAKVFAAAFGSEFA